MRTGNLQRDVLAFPFDVTWMATSGNGFAADVLRKIFPIPEVDFRILADNYLSHLTPLFGPVVALDFVGAYYRVHGANNYEIPAPTIDLHHIRQTIVHCHNTHIYLVKFAKMLGLMCSCNDENDILSVSYIANRVISLKFDRLQHPIKEDTLLGLFALGVTASMRRFDVPLSTKIMFLLWFAAAIPAPKPLARWLARIFFFPETRGTLSRLHRMFQPAQ
jgi:hypothetical protein